MTDFELQRRADQTLTDGWCPSWGYSDGCLNEGEHMDRVLREWHLERVELLRLLEEGAK